VLNCLSHKRKVGSCSTSQISTTDTEHLLEGWSPKRGGQGEDDTTESEFTIKERRLRWFGQVLETVVFEITCNISSRALNPTITYLLKKNRPILRGNTRALSWISVAVVQCVFDTGWTMDQVCYDSSNSAPTSLYLAVHLSMLFYIILEEISACDECTSTCISSLCQSVYLTVCTDVRPSILLLEATVQRQL